VDPRHEFGPGRYVIKDGYWHAYIGDQRVNGGICSDYLDGAERATRAIALARNQMLHEQFYWDAETCDWVRKGELPPVS